MLRTSHDRPFSRQAFRHVTPSARFEAIDAAQASYHDDENYHRKLAARMKGSFGLRRAMLREAAMQIYRFSGERHHACRRRDLSRLQAARHIGARAARR